MRKTERVAEAWAAYKETTNRALEAYARIVDAAHDAYIGIKDGPHPAHREAGAWAVYVRVVQAVDAAYQEVEAEAAAAYRAVVKEGEA